MEILKSAFLLIGSILCLVAGIGVYRLPDLITRQHAATIAGTLGAGLILAAAALHFQNLSTATLCLTTVIFLMITAPVASHLLVISAYRSGIKLSGKIQIDQLAEKSDKK